MKDVSLSIMGRYHDIFANSILRLFEADQMPQSNNCQLVEQITDILYGSKKIRMGNAPTPDEKLHMMKLVSRYVAQGAPLDFVLMWGCLKGYGLDDNRSIADIMDLTALFRFVDLNARLKMVYSPGLRVRMVREDVTERVLVGDSVVAKLAAYMESLDGLVRVFHFGDTVAFHDESMLLRQREVSYEQFRAAAEHNSSLLWDYWAESAEAMYIDTDKLPTHNELKKAGWTGTIPAEMWAYYLQRTMSEMPDAPHADRAKRICLYFGNTLARRQFRMLNGVIEDSYGVISPIKAAFAPYPPGVDPRLGLGRINYKVKANKKSHSTVQPWAGFGVMRPEPDGTHDLKCLSVQQFMAVRDTCQVMEVCARNGSEQTTFRADVIPA